MTNKPIIGISCRGIDESPSKPYRLVGVYQSYLNSIVEAGGAPILIPLGIGDGQLRSIFELCHGILIPGGEDVDPTLYNETAHPKLGTIDPKRDQLEITLSRWCVAEKKPLLGICRGLQVINVALGGSLYQDLPSQKPGQVEHDIQAYDEWERAAHSIEIDPESCLFEILERNTIPVNSLHHQAIKKLAPGLKVTATAPDGVIEAIEGSDDNFLVAVQCHPETLWQKVDRRWINLFGSFIAQSSNFR